MTAKQFSARIENIDDRLIQGAGQSQNARGHGRGLRRFVVIAAILSALIIGTAVAAVILRGDLWIQKPSNDPVETVRTALENQTGKDYTIRIDIKSVETDEAETLRMAQRFIDGPIAEWNGWSEEYLAQHFVAVKAVYNAEYDHTKTTRGDGEVTMYFYLIQDVDSGKWTIVDNSGNVNRPETAGDSDPVAKSVEEQLFSYLSELFDQAYSLYYDGLRYEMRDYQERTDDGRVTATFLWTMHFLGKRWDVGSDEGVEQEANWFLQATAAVDENGMLETETISILADESAVGGPDFSTPIEAYFPS